MDQLIEKPEYKLYTLKAITIATFFGGPLAAGILFRHNLAALDRKKAALNALFTGIMVTIALYLLIFSLPEHIMDAVPGYLLPALYTPLIFWIASRMMKDKLDEHTSNQGLFFSAWRAAGIGLICLVVIAAGLVGYAYVDENPKGFDEAAYMEKVSFFTSNEQEALQPYMLLEIAGDDVIIQEFRLGLALWEENRMVVEQMSAMKNLPGRYRDLNKQLMEYVELRVEHYSLIIKALEKNTDQYDQKLNDLDIRIEKLIKKLSNP
ncbi:MAG: hypothetical protein R6V49_05065 [Bacteroidales bacterium]